MIAKYIDLDKDLYQRLLNDLEKPIYIADYYADNYYKPDGIESHFKINIPLPLGEEHRVKVKDLPAKGYHYTEKYSNDMWDSYNDIPNGNPHAIIVSKVKEELAPSIKEIIKLIVDKEGYVGYNKVTCTLACKSKDFRLVIHTDRSSPKFTNGIRYHIIIKSNKDNYLCDVDDFEGNGLVEHRMDAGTIWTLDSTTLHYAHNKSTTDGGIHLIIDFME